ncbi:MAG: hypothetical protein DHS20C18_12530 [Saprospiraceae bacterium]|nr:MAG: hypothetical protein DHS20C18_12530 [Saprospiraceae bacterium]
MAFVQLDIPLLVQNIIVEHKPHYYLRPLFIPYPVATHRRYDLALAQLKKEIKHVFKGYAVTRKNLDNLLWFKFHPKLKYQQVYLNFRIKNDNINGPFTIASFEMKGMTFIFLPALNNYLFIASRETDGSLNIEKQAIKVIRHLLKRVKEDQEGEFKPDAYYSSDKEFITSLKLNVHVANGPTKYGQEGPNWLFNRQEGEMEFNGALEVEKVGYDITSLYPVELGRAYYQDTLVEKLFPTFFLQGNIPVVLVGPKGVGKHSVVHETVRRYLTEKHEKTQGRVRRIWHIDPTRIISGMSIVGMWQKRFETILEYIRFPESPEAASDLLLVDNPVALLRIGKSADNNMTLSDVLRPYLEKRQMSFIMIATTEEWKILQEKNRSFSDLFQVFRVQQPSLETATKIVLKQRKILEMDHGCEITINAISQLFTIQRNYLSQQALPGSILGLLKHLSSKYRYRMIDAPEVREEFKHTSGLSESIFDERRIFEKEEVRELIGRQLVGQKPAVEALTNAIHLIKAKLNDKNRPVSSFLFIGPTGVGKTQAAKILSNFLMGQEESLIRFDMNEYIDDNATQRLIGDYFNPEGQLTGKVRYQPFGVLLLDEIEKAHPKVHDLLLQVLDDGRLTDSLGRTVDFTNLVIIMTSNLGAEKVGTSLQIGNAPENRNAVFRKAIEQKFRPEFINRIDQIVIFRPLELENILGIARLQIKELLSRDGFVRRTTILNITQDALEWVARRGYDPKMGGRALKRQIERDLTTLSAEQLIATKGNNPIIFDVLLHDNQLVPRITDLEFAPASAQDFLPNLPDLKSGKKFYGQLLRRIEDIENQITAIEIGDTGEMLATDEATANWQYYHFKNRLAELKEHIQNTILGFSDRYHIEGPALPLRLKPNDFNSRKDWSRGLKESFRDRFFQEEGLREISNAYQFAPAPFDSLSTEFINNYLDVAILDLQSKGFFRRKLDRVKLQFESCITGIGDEEIAFLLSKYTDLLQDLDLQHEVKEKEKMIIVEGYSAIQLLKEECGIQLFYMAHQNPLPIRVRLDTERKSSKPDQFQVIRIFDSKQTLMDLRTAYSNAANITAKELKLLVYGGLTNSKEVSILKI